MIDRFEDIDQVVQELGKARYIADRALATVLYLAHRLEKPIFLEGEPGVGKRRSPSSWRASFRPI